MLTNAERQKAVEKITKAQEDKIQSIQPSIIWPNITIDDAYAISRKIAENRIKSGGKIVGHKVGLTSKAMQRSSKIDEPDYGHIFEDMIFNSGSKLEYNNFCMPRVEPELTFILRDTLTGPNISLIDVIRATEYVVPSIEIIDARVLEPRKIFDTVSDNGAAAALIMGGRPVRPDDIDLPRVGVIFRRNNEIEETGIAAAVLEHPAMAVAWLANKLFTYGISLDPGHLILSGSFTRPVWADPGDTLHADFGPLGTVTVRFQ